MGAMKKDELLILYIISIARVTSRGGIVSLGHSFDSQGVGTKSEATLQITSRGISRSMYLGRMYGQCVTRALLVGRAHHWW